MRPPKPSPGGSGSGTFSAMGMGSFVRRIEAVEAEVNRMKDRKIKELEEKVAIGEDFKRKMQAWIIDGFGHQPGLTDDYVEDVSTNSTPYDENGGTDTRSQRRTRRIWEQDSGDHLGDGDGDMSSQRSVESMITPKITDVRSCNITCATRDSDGFTLSSSVRGENSPKRRRVDDEDEDASDSDSVMTKTVSGYGRRVVQESSGDESDEFSSSPFKKTRTSGSPIKKEAAGASQSLVEEEVEAMLPDSRRRSLSPSFRQQAAVEKTDSPRNRNKKYPTPSRGTSSGRVENDFSVKGRSSSKVKGSPARRRRVISSNDDEEELAVDVVDDNPLPASPKPKPVETKNTKVFNYNNPRVVLERSPLSNSNNSISMLGPSSEKSESTVLIEQPDQQQGTSKGRHANGKGSPSNSQGSSKGNRKGTSNSQGSSKVQNDSEELDDEHEDAPCVACRDPTDELGNTIIFCDKCDQGFHQACYSVLDLPKKEEKWFCNPCRAGLNPAELTCCLCLKKGGALKPVKRPQKNSWAHVHCTFWINGPCLGDPRNPKEGDQVIHFDKIDKARWKLNCNICAKKGGAPRQCDYGACKYSFHPMCGLDAGLNMIMEDNDDLPGGILLYAYCPQHKDKPPPTTAVGGKGRKRKVSENAKYFLNI